MTKLTDAQVKALENAEAVSAGKPKPHHFRGNAASRMIERMTEADPPLIVARYYKGAGSLTVAGAEALAAHRAAKAKREAAAASRTPDTVTPAKLARFDDLEVARVDLVPPFIKATAVWADGSRSPFSYRAGGDDPLTIYQATDRESAYGSPLRVAVARPSPAKVAAILAAIDAAAAPAIEAALADKELVAAERAKREADRRAYHHKRDAGPLLFDILTRAMPQLAGDIARLAQDALAIARGEGLVCFDCGDDPERLYTVLWAADTASAQAAYAHSHHGRGGDLPLRPQDVFARPRPPVESN